MLPSSHSAGDPRLVVREPVYGFYRHNVICTEADLPFDTVCEAISVLAMWHIKSLPVRSLQSVLQDCINTTFVLVGRGNLLV